MKDILTQAIHQLCTNRQVVEEYTSYRTSAIGKILEMQESLVSIGAPKISYPFTVKKTPGYMHELRWFYAENPDETKNWYLTCGYKKEGAEKYTYDKPENFDIVGLTVFLDGMLYYFNLSISLVEGWNNKKEINCPIKDVDATTAIL